MTTTRGTQWEFFEFLTAGLYLKKKKGNCFDLRLSVK